MRCSCGKRVVIEDPARCEQHFIRDFERKVSGTIKKYKLIGKKDKVGVACSGGKDSTVLLHILKKSGYDVTALAVDEGIKGYRDRTLNDLERFCKENNIKLLKHSFKREFGSTLDTMAGKSGRLPCSVCGVLRRKLLNQYGKRFDVLATGHNLDDESQSIMMNLATNKLDVLARLGPRTGIVEDRKFSVRVKPLYFIKEREVMAYAFLNRLDVGFVECPHAPIAFRSRIRDELNLLEKERPGTKLHIVERFLALLPELKGGEEKGKVNACSNCGEPSRGEVCKACQLLAEVSA